VRQQGEKARIEQEALDRARACDDLAEGDLAGVATKSLSIAVIGQRSRFDHLAVLRAPRRILRNSASRSPMDAAGSMDAAGRPRRLEVILVNSRRRGWIVSGAHTPI